MMQCAHAHGGTTTAGRRRGGLCRGRGSGDRAAAPAGPRDLSDPQTQFQLDDEQLEALKDELIKCQRLAADEDGACSSGWATLRPLPRSCRTRPGTPASPQDAAAPDGTAPAASSTPEAERRQLTVLFCDLVDSTALSAQLDPEDLREVVRAYQDTCAKVIARFEGHIAQYLGDGLLVYFGYPLAHEDDAQRAVRAGLGMLEALGQLNTRLTQERGVHLAVRLGVHTGLVVVGEVGGGTRQEQLALGETPNLAARLQGLAAPNTLVISATTFQLLGGFFACQPLGTPLLKGQAQPLAVYRVLYESMARSRLEAAGSTGWTPLVGREQEIGLLVERWAQVKDGLGQVVLLSGEAGIGKSRLVQVLKEQVAAEPQAWLTPCQCSPYHQHTALYPMDRSAGAGGAALRARGVPAAEAPQTGGLLGAVWPAAGRDGAPLCCPPLPAAASGLCAPDRVARAAEAADAARPPDDPAAHRRAAAGALCDGRPALGRSVHAGVPQPPGRSRPHRPYPGAVHLSARLQPALDGARAPHPGDAHRLPRHQAAEMIRRVAHGKALPPEVVAQIVAKTDGVPLFVEELTKMVLESGLLQEREERYELTGPLPPLAIPTTLHDSLMARLDRLAAVKGLAQLGATLGREFSYELLQAVAPWDEAPLQQGLHQLVEAEFLYQRGLPPQATYLFKHALIQDAAYQSLLRSTRQQYHQRIAEVLEARFSEAARRSPNCWPITIRKLDSRAGHWLLAAGGQLASDRSAHLEAVAISPPRSSSSRPCQRPLSVSSTP